MKIILSIILYKGFSKNRDASRFSSMTCIRCKASNRRNTVCISRFDNAADDTSHRKAAAKEVFRGSHNIV